MKWFDLGQEYTGNWNDGLQDGHGENTWYEMAFTITFSMASDFD